MDIRMVDTITQYEKIRKEIDTAIAAVLDSGAYISGPSVAQFKKHLAEYLDVPYVIPCANGTDALQVALMALDIQPGDEVITSPFTFVATVEVIALLRARPVFVDVHPGTFNLDPSKLEAAITSRTRAIVPVHLFGQCADMEPIMDIARRHKIPVVEDNAQAIGAVYRFSDGSKKRAGSIGEIGTTSFYPSKNLGAYGDAGAVFTNNPPLAEKINVICNHGSKIKYYHESIGINSRLDSIQAAILDVKLGHLDAYNAARIQAADVYDSLLKDCEGVVIPERATTSSHVFHQYTIRITAGREERDRIKNELAAAGVPSMVYYPVALHLQDAYREYGFKEGDFPITEKLTEEVLSLPMHTELNQAQQVYIAETLKKIVSAVKQV
ncbi:MAG: DegT/DnrJ/EryC1/StrS family aminotransferase [Bacteroidia bacterium]|nr:DegT/DnrJ/EryC1/StrS family aminotransferase [Bacteroidia bacterium]